MCTNGIYVKYTNGYTFTHFHGWSHGTSPEEDWCNPPSGPVEIGDMEARQSFVDGTGVCPEHVIKRCEGMRKIKCCGEPCEALADGDSAVAFVCGVCGSLCGQLSDMDLVYS